MGCKISNFFLYTYYSPFNVPTLCHSEPEQERAIYHDTWMEMHTAIILTTSSTRNRLTQSFSRSTTPQFQKEDLIEQQN